MHIVNVGELLPEEHHRLKICDKELELTEGTGRRRTESPKRQGRVNVFRSCATIVMFW